MKLPTFIFNKTHKNTFIIILLCAIFFIFSAVSYSKAVTEDISSKVFRLHIVANSDTEEDQNLKYKVRDGIIDYMNFLTSDIDSKAQAISIAKEHLADFKNIAQKIVYENGFDYPIAVEIGNFDFPTKYYGDISLPSGYYDALRIKIGNSEGHNWWCVMFPPLCFVDVSSGVVPDESKQNLQENLSQEDYSIISEDSGISIFKFKIIEMINNLTIKLAQNND